MAEDNFGIMNGHSVGRILKETVRRAIVEIRGKFLTMNAEVKEDYDGNMEDVFTDADTTAQKIYLRAFRECFPGFGVIGEEGKLQIPCSIPGRNLYFTVDPLDGTKAYIRRQSHGVATMVALVEGDKVLSAYIGDINTEEIYGYRPGSGSVHRITDLNAFEQLTYRDRGGWGKRYALLRDPAGQYSDATCELIPRFKNYEVMGSSIGTWFARLWKGEVAAAILPAGKETPWDSTPVIGISKKLGYLFLRPNGEGTWTVYDPTLPTKVFDRPHDTLVLHQKELNNL